MPRRLNRISLLTGISFPGSRRTTLALYLLLVPLALGAQDFVEIDKETYQLYLDKQWEQLIRKGKEALSDGIDYYYLRMRIGIAFYEQKDYRSARVHFRQALRLNENDPVATEYLYFSCLLAGQAQQAAILYEDIPEGRRKDIPGPGLKIIDRVGVEFLFCASQTDELLENPYTFSFVEDPYEVMTRDFHNMSIYLSHSLKPGFSLSHGYTYLDKSNFYYYNSGIDSFRYDGQKVKQHQYYISPAYTAPGGLTISPAFHYLSVAYEVPYRVSSGSPGPGGNQPIPVAGGGYVALQDYRINQYVAGINVFQEAGKFRIRFSAVYSNLNFADQLSARAGVIWYPQGNLDIYLGGEISAHSADIQNRELGWIQDFIFGYGIASKVWLEIAATGGPMRNYTESNGFIVYNSLDWMKYKVLASISVPLTPKGSRVYLGGRFADYTNDFLVYYSFPTNPVDKVSYNSFSLYGGLSWKF